MTARKRTLSMLSYKYCTAPDMDDEYLLVSFAYGSDDDYLQTFMVPGSELPEDIRTDPGK